MQHFICQPRGDATPSSSSSCSCSFHPSLLLISPFSSLCTPAQSQLPPSSVSFTKLFTPYLTFPLSFSVSPFISQKASAISWHDTACHQHCLPPVFDRGISSPLPFLSLFFFVFSLLYFCLTPPPHVSCHLLPIVSVVFSGGEIRQL